MDIEAFQVADFRLGASWVRVQEHHLAALLLWLQCQACLACHSHLLCADAVTYIVLYCSIAVRQTV